MAVGAGAVIALAIVAPTAQLIEFAATGLFYGMLFGLLFELYRWALTCPVPPRRR